MTSADDPAAPNDAGENRSDPPNPSKLVRFDFPPGATPEQIAEALRKLTQGEPPDAGETR
jgi:hypothetical protein